MPIIIRSGAASKLVSASSFGSEKDLETLLINHPELLGDDSGPDLAFVSSQIRFAEAGIADLLFVTNEGLPVVVEVKLARNAESRREVVAQAIDYLAALTELTVDELDSLVGNKLEKALRKVTSADDAEFDQAWTAVGSNLRAGKARLIVALDEAPLALERIFRFLARYSDLDVQLLAVQSYADPAAVEASTIFVPRLLVNPEAEIKPGRPTSRLPQKSMDELLASCANSDAVEYFKKRLSMDMNSGNNALAYRQAGKYHWYVEPTKKGAKVTQIDRFNDDEPYWNSRLSNPRITIQRYGSNLRFDLIVASDFQLFVETVESGAEMPWLKSKAQSVSP